LSLRISDSTNHRLKGGSAAAPAPDFQHFSSTARSIETVSNRLKFGAQGGLSWHDAPHNG
jgi:hypothetical protein